MGHSRRSLRKGRRKELMFGFIRTGTCRLIIELERNLALS